jgi:hypothetical protein
MATNIPYILQFAHPDYKRPYVSTLCGSGLTENEIVKEMEGHIYNYLIEYIGHDDIVSGKIRTYEDIHEIIYSEYYMDNSVINERIFVDNEWKYSNIDYEEFLKRVMEKELKKDEPEVVLDNDFGINLNHIDEDVYDMITTILEEYDVESLCNTEEIKIALLEMIGQFVKEKPKPSSEEFKSFISEKFIKKYS